MSDKNSRPVGMLSFVVANRGRRASRVARSIVDSAALLIIFGAASGCASIWGFDDLTTGDAGADADATSEQTSGSSSGSASSSSGAGSSSGSAGSGSGTSSSSGASDGGSKHVDGGIDGSVPTDGGCQCETPGCCGTACETIHNDGVGQNFYDCQPPSTYTAAEALSACQAYAASVGQPSSYCSDGWGCSQDTSVFEVCHTSGANGTTCGNYCWVYQSSSENGWVTTCGNCQGKAAGWN